jgi:hypothetical protein
MRRPRPRLTYANVTATLALFLAVAGGTTAVALSGKNSVKSDDIAHGAVRSGDIKDKQVKNPDLAPNAVSGGKIRDATISAADLAPGSVGSAQIAAGAVGSAQIAAGSILGSDEAPVPAARVGGAGASIPDEAFETLPFSTDEGGDLYDPLAMWSPADPEHVVVPEAGVYLATGLAGWATDTTAGGPLQDQGWKLIQVSGGSQNWRDTGPANRFGSEPQRQVVTGPLRLDAGDSVVLSVAQSNEDASVVKLIEYSLAVVWVGPAP